MRTLVGVVAAAGLFLTLGTGSATAQPLVDCDPDPPPVPPPLYTSIQAALNDGFTFVDFRGSCVEDVFIGRDGVVLKGEGPETSIIVGGISVSGATEVRLEDFAARDGFAVDIFNGSYVRINRCVFENMTNGLEIFRSSGAQVDQLTVNETTGKRADNCAAICVFEDSSLRMTRSTITDTIDVDTTGPILLAFRDSSITIRGGNTITNNGNEAAVGAFYDSSLRQDNPFGFGSDIVNGGMHFFGMSYADIRQAEIYGDTLVDFHSAMNLGSEVFGGDPDLLDINGNVILSGDSALQSLSQVEINGDLVCEDRESSLRGQPQVAGIFDCTGFDPARSKRGVGGIGRRLGHLLKRHGL